MLRLKLNHVSKRGPTSMECLFCVLRPKWSCNDGVVLHARFSIFVAWVSLAISSILGVGWTSCIYQAYKRWRKHTPLHKSHNEALSWGCYRSIDAGSYNLSNTSLCWFVANTFEIASIQLLLTSVNILKTRMWNMISSPATPTDCLEQKSENFQSCNGKPNLGCCSMKMTISHILVFVPSW